MDGAADPEEERVIEAEMDELANKVDEVDEQLTETDATFTGLIAAPFPPLPTETTTHRMMVDRAGRNC